LTRTPEKGQKECWGGGGLESELISVSSKTTSGSFSFLPGKPDKGGKKKEGREKKRGREEKQRRVERTGREKS